MLKKLMVMDSSGDSEVKFDPEQADADTTKEAKALFDRLTKKGAAVFAVNRASGASDKRVTDFNTLEEENVVVPGIIGG